MFGKKKKEEAAAESVEKDKGGKGDKKGKKDGKSEGKELVPADGKSSVKKKRKFFSLKMIFIFLLIVSLSVAGFVVYKIYFGKKENVRIYVKRDLPNVVVADEVIRFTFDFIPEIYNSIILYNDEVILLENEIKRLNALGEQFPDQVKISEKEMRNFEKEKDKLKQSYEKLQKKVEALYVTYRVNQETGAQQLGEQKAELILSAKDSLAPALELTKRVHGETMEKIPEGFFKGTIFKIRKKINSLINR